MGGRDVGVHNNQDMMKKPKPVQEMIQQVINGDISIPERYLNNVKDVVFDHNDIVNGADTEDSQSKVGVPLPPLMDAPFIDMGRLLSPPSSGNSTVVRSQELAKLREVLSTWGCFQLVNHGMTSTFLDQVRGVSKQFFALPQEEKLKYARKGDDIEGYGTDQAYEQNTINWVDRLHLVTHPKEKRQLEFWPQEPKPFREVIEEFTSKCQLIVEVLLKTMALSLNIDENGFLDQYGSESEEQYNNNNNKGIMFARFNYYPPCPRPDLVLGIKPHTDGTAITILLQDREVEALQVQKDDQWFRAPTIPDALFINAGDQMEIMSNGFIKSAFHRVMTNANKDRISVAMLSSPDPETEIGPIDELIINDKHPKLFNNVKHYGSLYFQIDPTDENTRPIDLLRIK